MIERGVPVTFTTGCHPNTLPARFEDILNCGKPMDVTRTVAAIGHAIYERAEAWVAQLFLGPPPVNARCGDPAEGFLATVQVQRCASGRRAVGSDRQPVASTRVPLN